jgi:hypothetical protein
MKKPIDIDKLPKDRRDWIGIFGNQWGPRRFDAPPMTAEDNQALLDALNPFTRTA